MAKRKKAEKFIHIGTILPDTLLSFRKDGDGELIKIWSIWKDAVGEAISENTRPAAFKGKKLIVHVSSSPWVQQLVFLKKDIIEKLNLKLGKKLLDDIKFTIGPL